MVRFILLTFGFLAWGYYEMSGGSEFEPRVTAQADTAIETAPESSDAIMSAAAATAPASTARPNRITPADGAEGNVELAAFTPASDPAPLGSATPASFEASDDSAVLTPVAADPNARPAPRIEPVSFVAESEAEEVPAIDAAQASREIRLVDGSRVNMREGPSTRHTVVTTLSRGAETAVLEEPGTGWVKIKALDSGQVGWMAGSLLRAKS